MQILSLELTNVKGYEHARYTFTPGVNAIVGPNGAGKSTIIEAIGYALFDALPYTTAEFVREGARTGTVAVTFLSDFDERPYRVERRFGGSNSYVVYDEEFQAKVCDGKADVAAFMRQHTVSDASLDLTRLFNDALGVAQGTLTAAFAETPSRRKPIFDTLLQVDDYASAFDRLRDPDRHLRDRIGERERDLAVLATRLEQLPPLEAAVRSRVVELATAGDRVKALAASLAALQEQLQRLEAQRALVDTLSAQQLRAEDSVRSLETVLARAEQALAEADAAAATVATNQPGYDAYCAAQQAQEAVQAAQRRRQALLATRATADKELALAKSTLAQLEQTLDGIADAEQIMRNLAPDVARQEQIEQQLAALDREQSRLGEIDRRLAEMTKRQQQLAERQANVAEGCRRAKAVEADGHAINAQMDELRRVLDRQRSEAATLAAEVKAVEEQTARLAAVESAVCPVCEQPLGDAERVRLLERNHSRLAELQGQGKMLQRALENTQRALDEADKERARLQREWSRLPREAELDEIAHAQATGDAELLAAKDERAQVEAVVAEIEPLRRQLHALDDPRKRNAIAATQAAQRTAVAAQIQRAAAQVSSAEQSAAAADAGLHDLADVDVQAERITRTLAEHSAAYQALLTHRQLAEGRQRRADEAAEVAQQLDAARAFLAKTEQQFKAAFGDFDRDKHERLLLDDRRLRAEQGGLDAQIELMQAAQVRDEAAIAVLRADQARHAELAAERDHLANLAEALAAIRSVIKQAGPFVTQALVRQISEGAAQIFGELMQDHSRQLAWGEDYGITLETGGHERHFRQLSGGEQMSAALAVRLALVREMSELNIAFFDEPTANLDALRREALAQQIMSIRGFTQLFVISHDDTFEQATQNIIRVSTNGDTTLARDSSART